MGRFDDLLNKKEAADAAAKRKQDNDEANTASILERKKAEYYPVISKYLNEFRNILPRLEYYGEIETTVLGMVKKRIKIRSTRNISARNYIEPGTVCYDVNGNWYKVKEYVSYRYAEILPPARKMNHEETVEAIFDTLPWEKCLPYWKGEKENDYGKESVIHYMIAGNADEAVALFFEGLIS